MPSEESPDPRSPNPVEVSEALRGWAEVRGDIPSPLNPLPWWISDADVAKEAHLVNQAFGRAGTEHGALVMGEARECSRNERVRPKRRSRTRRYG